MKNISGKERQILQVLKKTKRKEYSKKIAEAAGMSSQTAVKYLMSLEGKGLVVKDDSQRPHIFWELATEA
jgi:DNA-binding MarR family transcriptional regulator